MSKEELTVRELREKLAEYPDNMEVFVDGYEDGLVSLSERTPKPSPTLLSWRRITILVGFMLAAWEGGCWSMNEYVEAVYAGRIMIEPLAWSYVGLSAVVGVVLYLLYDAIRCNLRGE